MNTLEMAIELRKNPNLKATCVVGDILWRVKCVNGSLMWEDKRSPSKFLDMSDCILRHNNWSVYSEEKKSIELYGRLPVTLNNGIGELPDDYKIIGDIYVTTSDNTVHTIRPIGKKFAVPTNDINVLVFFKHERVGYVCKFL